MDKRRIRRNYKQIQSMKKLEVMTEIVATHFKCNVDSVKGKRKTFKLVQCRQLISFFARKFTPITLKEIGDYFGRDHTTIIHNCNVVKNAIETKTYVHDDYKYLEPIIQAMICSDVTRVVFEFPNGFNVSPLISEVTAKYDTVKYHLV
jgi:chromosomal replication initiator protein